MGTGIGVGSGVGVGVTVRSKVSVTAAPALSVAVTLILISPTFLFAGVSVMVRVMRLNVKQEGKSELWARVAFYVNVFPASILLKVPVGIAKLALHINKINSSFSSPSPFTGRVVEGVGFPCGKDF